MKAAPIHKQVRSGSLTLAVRRYGDGRYGFDYHPPGESRVKVRLQHPADAETKARELVGAAEAGRVQRLEIDPVEYMEFLRWKAQRKTPAMIATLVPVMLDLKEAKGRSVVTLRELRSTLLPFAVAFPGPIAELRRADVEKWLSTYEGRPGSGPVGPRRWNNMRAAICALHRFARGDGLLPAELTPVERIERRAVTLNIETYTPAEMRAILAVVPREWLPLVVLGGLCGPRIEELSPDPTNGGYKPGLVWENILWDKQKIDVPPAVSKVRRRRFANLSEAAIAFLGDRRGETGPILPRVNFRKLSRAWCEAAGTRWKPNGLRHSYASYRLAITKDAPALALEMGNSPGMIFRHYLDLKHEEEAREWFAIRPEKG